MKILLLECCKIKYAPYINFYLENLDRQKHELSLLYWNRDLKPEDLSAYEGIRLYEFKFYQEDDIAKTRKIKGFFKFREYVKEVFKQNDFDFVIVFNSFLSILFFNILTKQFKSKYILDYRDSSYESITLYKKLLKIIVNYSFATFVSSDAFRRFLPKSDKIYTSHNILSDSLKHRDEKLNHNIESDKIRVSFWGMIRHEDINKTIINRFKKDDRFELHYYGREQQIALNLKKYVKEVNATNVFFHGEYKAEQRYEFVRNTDLIHNLYLDNNTMLAMGNKYYDGIIFRVPQLCITGSFMGELVNKNNIGFECNPEDDNFTNLVYDYYVNINKTEFYDFCDKELKRVLIEYEEGKDIIRLI